MGIVSWWNRLRGRSAAPEGIAAADPDAPAHRVATEKVSDELTIHEYHHTMLTINGPIPVRTFMTEGLVVHKAREVRVTVPADWDKAARILAGLFSSLQRLAADGRSAELGGWTAFQATQLAGDRLIGVAYARGTPIHGIPGADAALVAVLLHGDEIELVQHGLMTRVLGLLATRARVFPYPACWELRATPVLRAADQAKSLLEKMPRATVSDLRVTAIEESSSMGQQTMVVLSVAADATEQLRTLWSDASMRLMALIAKLSPNADGQATWVPDSPERTVNTAGNASPRRIGFSFVMLTGTNESPPGLGYLEDGVGVILPEPALDQLREALISGKELTLPIDDRSRLVLEVRPTTLLDPFTGAQHHAPGGWELYRPESPRAQTGPLKIDQIVLLLPDEELRARIDVEALVLFTKSAEQVLERLAALYPVDAPVEIAIGMTLLPGERPKVQLAFRGAREVALLSPLLAELQALAPAPARGEVPFRIEATVRPPQPGN